MAQMEKGLFKFKFKVYLRISIEKESIIDLTLRFPSEAGDEI